MNSQPPLPTLQALTRELRDLNRHCDGPWTVGLCIDRVRWGEAWGLDAPGTEQEEGPIGSEDIPGDDRGFDACAAARRLLAAARDYMMGLEGADHDRPASELRSVP